MWMPNQIEDLFEGEFQTTNEALTLYRSYNNKFL